VMPHAIYAHSALTRDRFPRNAGSADRRTLLRATRIDVTIALAVAGSVNVVILLIAAASLRGAPDTDTLQGAQRALTAGLGAPVGVLFAVALLASGLASTSVGAYAGAEIMRGLLLRRLVTLIPALAVLSIGVDPTLALVISQVVLSFGIPFALLPLVTLTARRSVMGESVNRPGTTVASLLAAAFLIVLNGTLLWLVLTGA
jgi:manganese transport protein